MMKGEGAWLEYMWGELSVYYENMVQEALFTPSTFRKDIILNTIIIGRFLYMSIAVLRKCKGLTIPLAIPVYSIE